jgi:hypothetical protein
MRYILVCAQPKHHLANWQRYASLFFFLFFVLMTGCATMANIDQQISITSVPDGADVKIGNMSGTTPMTVTVPGGYGIPQAIQIYKEGYQPQTVAVQRGFRTGALVQDIIPGILLGPIPLLTDAVTGDWWYVANSSYNVRLQPIPGSSGVRPEIK